MQSKNKRTEERSALNSPLTISDSDAWQAPTVCCMRARSAVMPCSRSCSAIIVDSAGEAGVMGCEAREGGADCMANGDGRRSLSWPRDPEKGTPNALSLPSGVVLAEAEASGRTTTSIWSLSASPREAGVAANESSWPPRRSWRRAG